MGDVTAKGGSGRSKPRRTTVPYAVSTGSDEVRLVLDRLLSEADIIADRLATRPPEIEARERELDELEDLRVGLVERTEAANERFGTAERLVEQSRARLAEIAAAQQAAKETLEVATERAASIVAEAEAKAAALQAQAERKAVARIRRSEREAADRLVDADNEAKRILAEAMLAFQDAERRATETVASVQRRVDDAVEAATHARHADIEQLHAREREVEDRIQQLLAEADALNALPRAEPRRDADRSCAEPASTIDLTDVSAAFDDAIDTWSSRRRSS